MVNDVVKFTYVGDDFEVAGDGVFVPSRKDIPDWYKALSARVDTADIIDTTAKMCMPFNDAIKLGWLLRSPTRISFTSSGDVVVADESEVDVEKINEYKEPSSGNSKFRSPTHLLTLNWSVSTPDGYSTLFTHPLNREIESYRSISKMVETDGDESQVTVPIYVDGDGMTIDENDLLYQLIPIKRNDLLQDFEMVAYEDGYEELHMAYEGFRNALQKNRGYYRQEARLQKPNERVVHEEDDYELDEFSDVEINDRAALPFQEGLEKLLLGASQTQKKGMADVEASADCIDDEFKEFVEDVDLLDGESILSASGLGCMLNIITNIEITTNADTIDISQEGSVQGVKTMNDKQIGEGNIFLPEGNLVNFTNNWVPCVPMGYALLFIRPINHFQDVYKSYSGMVDCDSFYVNANAPSIVKRGGKHSINKGENICQLIPIKRDSLLQNAVVQEG